MNPLTALLCLFLLCLGLAMVICLLFEDLEGRRERLHLMVVLGEDVLFRCMYSSEAFLGPMWSDRVFDKQKGRVFLADGQEGFWVQVEDLDRLLTPDEEKAVRRSLHANATGTICVVRRNELAANAKELMRRAMVQRDELHDQAPKTPYQPPKDATLLVP